MPWLRANAEGSHTHLIEMKTQEDSRRTRSEGLGVHLTSQTESVKIREGGLRGWIRGDVKDPAGELVTRNNNKRGGACESLRVFNN
jgi:hypothetical protein